MLHQHQHLKPFLHTSTELFPKASLLSTDIMLPWHHILEKITARILLVNEIHGVQSQQYFFNHFFPYLNIPAFGALKEAIVPINVTSFRR